MPKSSIRRLAQVAALLLAGLGTFPPVLAQTPAQDLELYDQPRFSGSRLRLQGDTPDVTAYGLGGRVASIIIQRGRWEFCTAVQYGGACITVGPGRYAEMPLALRGNLASVRRADGGPAMPAMPAPPPTAGVGGALPGGPAFGRPPIFGPVVPGAGQVAEAIVLYEHSNCDGRALGLSAAAPHLGLRDFNDLASSVLIQRGRWQLCEHADYGGECLVLGPGRHVLSGRFNDVASSARPVFGNDNRPLSGQGALILFENADFSGRQVMRTEAVANLKALNMNDLTSAIEVWGGQWELCTDADHAGQCIIVGPGRYRLDPSFNERISSLRPR